MNSPNMFIKMFISDFDSLLKQIKGGAMMR